MLRSAVRQTLFHGYKQNRRLLIQQLSCTKRILTPHLRLHNCATSRLHLRGFTESKRPQVKSLVRRFGKLILNEDISAANELFDSLLAAEQSPDAKSDLATSFLQSILDARLYLQVLEKFTAFEGQQLFSVRLHGFNFIRDSII